MPAEPAPAGAPSVSARVFFALWPPSALASQLASIAQQFAQASGGRPSRQETLHLTLAFLGDLAEARLPELCRAATAVEAPPFELQLDKLDFWSHKHLLWGGFTNPCPVLEKLVGDLRSALLAAGFSSADPGPGFVPHVTLLRRLPAGISAGVLRLDGTLSLPLWQCHRFVLVRSCLSASGADYRVLAEFPLGGGFG